MVVENIGGRRGWTGVGVGLGLGGGKERAIP